MEVFTFIFMGGDLSRITLLPISERTAGVEPQPGGDVEAAAPSAPPPSSRTSSFTNRSDPAVRAILDKFATFDAAEAECYLPDDKQMILGVIETGIGSVDAFNQLVRKAFAFKNEKKRFSMRSPTQAIVIGMEGGASAGAASGRRPSRDSGRRPSSI